MRSARFYDIGDLDENRTGPGFLNDLHTRCQQRRVPFMVEDPPEQFVPRHRNSSNSALVVGNGPATLVQSILAVRQAFCFPQDLFPGGVGRFLKWAMQGFKGTLLNSVQHG